MSLPPESREEAIARLNKSASDLEARTARQISHEAAGQAAAGQAWRTAQRLMAEAKQHGEPESVPFDDDEDQGV